MAKYNTGDQVRYKPVGGMSARRVTLMPVSDEGTGPDSNTSESTGTIKGVLTSPGQQASRNVQASDDMPRYEVKRP